MKIINIKLITFCLLILGWTITVQSQTRYRGIINNNSSFLLNIAFPPVPGNKYCADAVSPLTDAEIDEIVRIHNQVRAEVGTAPLKWNCDLAKFSQSWANADTFEHSTPQQREQIIKGGMAGENLAIDSGSTALMAALNKGWIDERQFWNNSTNTCETGKVCGHYTQMVWRTTNEVGCGIIRTSKKLGDEFSASYFVCTYYPGGNTEGEKAY